MNEWPYGDYIYKSNHQDKFIKKFPKKLRPYLHKVLMYLELEYGVHVKLLSPSAIAMTDGVPWGGKTVPESARLIMEGLWQQGYPRLDFEE